MKKIAAKITEIAKKKLAWGCAVIAITQLLGYMPSIDFLPPMYHKYISFGLGMLLTIMKSVEMYYEKAEQLIKAGEISFDTEVITQPSTEPKP